MPPTRSQILTALKATTPPAAASGGYGAVTPPYLSPGPSPLVASYNEWTSGRANGTTAALPRDWQTFLSGMFGPLAPIQPVPVDTPDDGDPRPGPRRRQYPVGWDMPMGMPGTERFGKLASFDTLRTIADSYSVARACIELRKAELRGIGWDIAPTKDASKVMRGDHKAMGDFAARRAQALAFFKRPDPDYADFTSWFDSVLEEVFVTDALSIYPHPSRLPGKGLLGSDVAALTQIDGTLIRPLLNVRGSKPAPPNPAYQQYLYGVPRSDLMSVVAGTDLDDTGLNTGTLAAEYRGDQLIYAPFTPRVWSPYGQAPIEQAIVPVMTGLRKQQYQLNYFDEGSIPGLFISPGDPNMTPQQVRELQDALNALAGDQAWKHKIIVLPGGSKVDPQRPASLADQFDEIVFVQVCMAFSVMPMELGISPKVSATQSTGAANQMAKACYTDDVEVLTRRGWLHFREVRTGGNGDEFATRNPETGAFQWQHATAYQEYDYDGELIEFTSTHGRQDKNDGLHLRVTPNHRMLTVEPVSKTSPVQYREYIRQAGSIHAQRISVPLTSTWEGNGPQVVRFGRYEWAAADFAAFLGAWIAEGHLDRQPGKYQRAGEWVSRGPGHVVKRIRVSQQLGSKGYEPYRELLTRMLGREASWNGGNFYFACAELWDYLNKLGHAEDKYIPQEVKDWPAPALRAFLDYYLLGDGYLENGAPRAKLTSRRLADDLQEIAQKLGMSATITPLKPRDSVIRGREISKENCLPQYLVRFNKSLTRRMSITRSQHTGKVFCVTVPNGIIYVRENGSPIWCGNSQDIQERKGTVPLLQWLKNTIFDFMLQTVCGQQDMEWQWEGLEQDEDAETLTGLLIQQIGAGMLSIDEARAELGKDPWGLPATSDPGWATMTTGFIPFNSPASPLNAPPPLPPGQHPALPPAAGQNSSSPASPAKPAGNTSSSTSAGNTASPPNTNSPGSGPAATPAHAAAQAAVNSTSTGSGGSGQASTGKALLRELDLLRLHLVKGRPVSSWQARDLTQGSLARIARSMAEGLNPDLAVTLERVWLTRSVPSATASVAGQVHAYLARNYPPSVLDWVEDCTWDDPRLVPLDDINGTRRAGGARDPAKIQAIRDRLNTGGTVAPVVAVDPGGGGKLLIADGWHRYAAVKANGGDTITAWVGHLPPGGGGFDPAEMGRAKLNKAGGGDDSDPKDWPGWEHDQHLAAAYAARLTAAYHAAARDIRALVTRWRNGKITANPAGLAARIRSLISNRLAPVLGDLWAEAWHLGSTAAGIVTGHASGWGTWKPGNPGTLPAPPPHIDPTAVSGTGAGDTAEDGPDLTGTGSLQDLLNEYGISEIKALGGAGLDDLEEAITTAVDAGDTAVTLARVIEGMLTIPARAQMIAVTEIARAVTSASLSSYRLFGVTMIAWQTAGPGGAQVCPACQSNQAAGPIRIGQDFPSGVPAPPGHPNCRCCVLPAAMPGVNLLTGTAA